MNKKLAYEIGYNTGRDIARCNFSDYDIISSEEQFVSDCLETESEHYRQFSPFEFTAKEFNDSHNPDAMWECYDDGVYKGIVSATKEKKRQYLIKTWRYNRFTVKLYDQGKEIDDRVYLSYEFLDQGKLIFQGSDFSPSPLYTIDSIKTIYALLSFLTLQMGDTDQEYFDNYTFEQLNWIQSDRAEDLRSFLCDKEG